MNPADILSDAFDRVLESAREAVSDFDAEQLAQRPDGRGNSIAWLIWHLTRVQDDHVSELADREQSWIVDGWKDRFDLDLPSTDTGFGHRTAQVSKVVVAGSLLTGYLADVTEHTKEYLRTLSESDYDEIIDDAWEPPVSRGVRLVSVANDTTQHVGQAAYVAGLFGRPGAF